ncbi:uncharacterized protein LOC121416829 [Lytechinus variegatus]|uniref:uncharacterized protein LOC121416829 n=1 Tax=Lytechinus variegatus TaxID=7654 RepID=UPI001BB210EA|nr:uncharacterized protein LOC121416829 [Lytechinus variegatus]XP_041466287.1 uncharacterized protein LOC121416829 [Lytechinus variegatus]
MEEVDYKRVREVMWTDKTFRLQELPAYFGFPLLIKVVKGSDDMEHKEKFAKGEILRIDGEERQRRVIATDSKGRHWSFPVHIGAKFDVKSKKEKRKSMYMSEIVEAEKLPKKFCFAKKDDMQIKITGEEHSGPLIEGDFKTKELTRVRIFKANRITDGDITLKVVFLPAYMDVEVVIATKLACEPDAYWDDYMDAMTRDINKKVNLNMYRGKSDIQIYEFSEKTKKSKAKAACLYEEQAPSKIVSIGSIIKQRPSSTKTRTPSRTPSTSSGGRNPNMSTFSAPEADPEPEEPKRAVKDILTDLQDKDESELTEEEVRVARHRRMLLAMLAREDEEEEEKRRSQIIPDGATFEGDEADGAGVTNDGDDQDDNDDKDVENDDDDNDDDDDSSDDESVNARGEGDGDVLDEVRRPRSPGDGSTYSAESENNESVFVDTPPEPVRQRPRIPTRRTPGLSYDHSLSSANAQPFDQEVNKPTKKSPPPPPVKPKPALPAGQKPPISPNKPVVPSREPALNRPVVPHVSTKISQARVVSASFATIQDFPADLRGLTIDDICKALEFLSLDKYKEQIRDNKIDGEMASELSEDMLKSDLGLSALEAKKLHKFIHHNWRPV